MATRHERDAMLHPGKVNAPEIKSEIHRADDEPQHDQWRISPTNGNGYENDTGHSISNRPHELVNLIINAKTCRLTGSPARAGYQTHKDKGAESRGPAGDVILDSVLPFPSDFRPFSRA